MGFGSIWPWLIVLIIVLLMFGRGRISHLMGDVAKGVKSFRSGLSDDDEEKKTERPIEQGKAEPVNQRTEERTNAG